MVTFTGRSIVPINFDSFQKFINSLVPSDRVESVEIKLDGREKVKSVFAKLEGTTLTIYTGAIVNCSNGKFPECQRLQSLILLFILYGIKKLNRGDSFEIKTTDASISNIKAETDFATMTKQLPLFENKLLELHPNAYDAVVHETPAPSPMVITETASAEPVQPVVKANKSHKKGASNAVFLPLENTPKIECPADLDLTQV